MDHSILPPPPVISTALKRLFFREIPRAIEARGIVGVELNDVRLDPRRKTRRPRYATT